MSFFETCVKIGVKFPKENVRLPKEWNKLTTSIYKNEDNYMVLAGKVNDIIVVDLDNKDSEFKAYKWFRNNLNNVQEINTLVTKTINNGFHIFFKYTDKIKNTNNKEYYIDILSDNKGSYQGNGYDIINNANIRQLTDIEIKKLKELKAKSKGNTELSQYKKANKLLKLPENTEWRVEETDNGKQLIPK